MHHAQVAALNVPRLTGEVFAGSVTIAQNNKVATMPAPQPDASVRLQIRDAFLPLLALFVASRVVLLLICWITATLVGTAPGFDGTLMSLLCRNDCTSYLSVAGSGYPLSEWAGQPGQTNFA
ncbi:MAG TPA: hypothetical protein VF132_02720, partial [Rudaea sp.]